MRTCVRKGRGVTTKPMAAALLEGRMREGWRTLPFSDADMQRPNYLYSVDATRRSPATAVVRTERRETVNDLVREGAWRGVTPM